ncbi:MAG: hypothetical protein AAGA77_14500 [Bacteroidota bacterium]
MKYIMNLIIGVMLCVTGANAQCYVQLTDALGFDSTPYQAELEAAACELVNAFPEQFHGDLKVFGVGRYTLSSFMEQEDFYWDLAKTEASLQANNYFLIGFIKSNDSDIGELRVEMVFDSEPYDCMDTETFNETVHELSRSYVTGENSLYPGSISLIHHLSELLFEQFCCSAYFEVEVRSNSKSTTRSSTCIDFDKVEQVKLMLATDIDFREFIEKLKQAIEYYQEIQESCGDWSSLGKNGVIPACMWQNSTVLPIHRWGWDPPVYAGVIDGAVSEFVDLKNVILSADDFIINSWKGIKKYIKYYALCKENIGLTSAELNQIMIELYEYELHDWVLTGYDAIYEGFSTGREWLRGLILGEQVTCEDLKSFGQTVDAMIAFVTDASAIGEAFGQLMTSLQDTWNDLDFSDNEDRYYVAYYAVKVGSALVGITKFVYKTALVTVTKLKNASIARIRQIGDGILVNMASDLMAKIRQRSWYTSLRDKSLFISDFATNFRALKFFYNNAQGYKAWYSLKNTPRAIRGNVTNLETVSRHLDETGKIADEVASEIAHSGNFYKWLSDNLITYVKNGFRINRTTIDDGFKHINEIKPNGVNRATYSSGSGIVGAHNIETFMKETVSNGKRIEIINNFPTSVHGVRRISYKVLALDSTTGNPIPGQYFASGSIFHKTTFDPNVFSPSAMKSIGYNGFRSAIDEGNFGDARTFNGISDSFPVAGHYKSSGGEDIISTWWIDAF